MAEPLWRTAAIAPARWQQVADQLQIPHRVAKWVCLRCPQDMDVADWWRASGHDWTSPYEFADMQRLVEVTMEAVSRGQRICVVGDYDVDGVTSSAILVTTLQAVGADVFCLIPHRTQDGYGLSPTLVDRARDNRADLIITVDNGIRAHAAVAHASACGLSVIVTDHHEPDTTLPDEASAIVHWSRCTTKGLTVLCGAGVALKTAAALLDHAGVSGARRSSLDSWFLGLACLGTLADLVALHGENRHIVTAGLSALRTSTHAGWQALCAATGLDPTTVDEGSISWHITPRINAAGRMDTAEIAFQLLMTRDDVSLAVSIAEQLEQLNQSRRTETEQATREALVICEQKYVEAPQAVVVAGPWPLGIVGIVAAKLSDTYGCAALVFADDGSTVWRGSGRAPDGVPLHSAVARCQHLLVHFGGHDAAIGCAVEPAQLAVFESALYQSTRDLMDEQPQTNVLVEAPIADDVLPLGEATLEMISWLDCCRPYGAGNPPLSFYIGPVTLEQIQWVGTSRKHVRGRVTEGRHSIGLIWFNAGEIAQTWRPGDTVGLIAHLELNVYRETREPQLRVTDGHTLQRAVLRDEFSLLYRLLKTRRQLLEQDALEVVPHRASSEVAMVLETFVELGFAERRASAYHVVEQATVRDLRDSLRYQQHLRQISHGSVQGVRMGQGETI